MLFSLMSRWTMPFEWTYVSASDRHETITKDLLRRQKDP